ncbi:MAG: hypothetical protein KC656_09215, partial [Myxococcales bacterium]|nr:hypothetical protein [Myxococcales bacterium]
GVRAWLAMLDAMDTDNLYFARCSEAVLSQMAMIRAFAGNGSITSFFAPYLCEGCGNAFQVLYDAIEDAPAIAESRPVDVQCPRCRTVCTLDDDPASFFRIGPLVEAPSEELKQALGKLPPLGVDADPIEKSVRDNLTVVKFNTRLDASVRLRRVFDGLEGRARFDMGGVPEVTERGATTFLRALDALDPEVRRVELVGCPEALAVALVGRPADDRVRVMSVVVRATCASPPGQRDVHVDIVEHGEALANGKPPEVRCDWCDDALSFRSQRTMLATLAQRLGFGEVAPEPEPEPEPSPRGRRLSIGLWITSMLATGSAVFAGLVGMVLLAALWYLAPTPGPPPNAWIAGRTPPPRWTETQWAEDTTGVHVVAGADAADLEAALETARRKALFQLVEHLRDALRDRAIHPLIPAPPYRDDPAWRAAVVDDYLAAVAPFGLPERAEVAVREGGPETRIFVRYDLAPEAWARVVEHYGTVYTFRGMDLSPRFPLQPEQPESDVLVVATRTWLAEPKAGDRLLATGDARTLDLQVARQELESQWDALPAGETLSLTFHDGVTEKRVPLRKNP